MRRIARRAKVVAELPLSNDRWIDRVQGGLRIDINSRFYIKRCARANGPRYSMIGVTSIGARRSPVIY